MQEIDSTLIFFVEIITKLLIDFSRDTILFLIYLLSDKGNFDYLFYYIYEYYEIMFELICHNFVFCIDKCKERKMHNNMKMQVERGVFKIIFNI